MSDRLHFLCPVAATHIFFFRNASDHVWHFAHPFTLNSSDSLSVGTSLRQILDSTPTNPHEITKRLERWLFLISTLK